MTCLTIPYSGLKKSKLLCTNVWRICSLLLVYRTYKWFFYMFDHTCSGLKKSKFLWVLHVVYCTYSGWKKSNFVYFSHVWPYLQWSEKVKILMGFCIWLTVLTVVKTGLNFYGFLHVIYCTYSGWKKSKFVYFWYVWQYLQWSEKV